MKSARKIFFIALLLFGVILLAYFLLRSYVAKVIIERIGTKLKAEYGLTLSTSEAEFTGFKTLSLVHISLIPEQGDTFLSLNSLEVSPSFLSLLRFHIRLDELQLKQGKLNLVCDDSICNYSGLLREKDNDEVKSSEKNYAKSLHRIYSLAFDIIPQHTEIHNFLIHYRKENAEEDILLQNCHSLNGELSAELFNSSNGARWKIESSLEQKGKQMSLKIYPLEKKGALPFLEHALNLSVDFDTLQFSSGINSFSSNEFILNGTIASTNLSLYQSRLSDDSVFIANSSSSYTLHATTSSIRLDSSSVITMNALRIHPFLLYSNNENKDYTLEIQTDETRANDFFQSLPDGMFNELDGVEADGDLQYSVDFHLNSEQPDSLTFNSEMKKDKFRLKNFGTNSLLKMNSEFSYTAYEHDKPFRTFMVGPSNPDFTPLDQVSPYMKNSILTSEDGSFFFHNGFNEDAFRKSIAANYRAEKFVRGGSTISMQLVKNVYLSRHKTIARKAEEALIVWLIESNHLCSKERMFEVYLNIVELGPGVYGVGEASMFYFNKKPSQLTLSESIFVASLLPHPKWFKYSFDENGNLKSYLADYYRVVTNFLLKKNLITEFEYNSIEPNVKLTGHAKELVVPSDTIPAEESEE